VDAKRFRHSGAGKVIKVGQGSSAYTAFVPNPLPPVLASDLRLWVVLSEADRALGEFGRRGTIPAESWPVPPAVRAARKLCYHPALRERKPAWPNCMPMKRSNYRCLTRPRPCEKAMYAKFSTMSVHWTTARTTGHASGQPEANARIARTVDAGRTRR